MLLGAVMLATSVAPMTAQRGNFNNGLRRGGGYNNQYDQRRYGNDQSQRDAYNRAHSGIGTGRGALIGGAGGAALGALFGGGLKGAIIGGGAGAGVGAIAGKIHSDNKKQDYRDGRYRR